MPAHKDFVSGRLALGVALSALLGTGVYTVPQVSDVFASPVWAEQGSGGQGSGGQGSGGQGSGGQGSAGQGSGQGGSQGAGSGQGKPVWAQEGIPEVELGRLSVARSPDAVLDRALAEAVASLTPEMIAYYNLSFDQVIVELSLNFDDVAFIDSPLQNLALLEDLLKGGTALSDKGVTTDSSLLAAMLLGAASDKTVPISADTVIAVTTILGAPITGTAAEDLAALAEAIRVAILAGHG